MSREVLDGLRPAAGGLLLLTLLAGCASTQPSAIEDFSASAIPGSAPAALTAHRPATTMPAPRWDRPARGQWQVESPRPVPGTYRVKRGDTVHSIARRYGLDYKDLVAWNNLPSPYVLYPGQTLRLTPGHTARRTREKTAHEATQHVTAETARKASPPVKERLPDAGQESSIAGTEAAPLALDKKSRPGLAQPVTEKDGIAWEWPAAGRIITRFNDSGNAKGVDIAGKLGEPVCAAASGKVVYSGSGLRGYGQLIIIKHSKTYLSAYAHNHRLLVKEGQNVTRGQKIAEMGSSDADQTRLHFEIRRLGKPVDPLQFLPTDRAL